MIREQTHNLVNAKAIPVATVGLFLVLATLVAGWSFAQTSSQSEKALVGGTLIDGNGGAPIQNAVVVIKGNRITAAGSRDKIKFPKTAQVIEVTGKFILPGLIDIHVHYNDWMGELFLAHGVMTVKDVGNYVEWVSVARDEIEQGKAIGPRLFYTGNGLDTPPPVREHFIGLDDPETAKRVVRLLHQRGATAIKAREKMTAELLRAIAEEAHKLGMPVTGHIRRVDAYEAALAGIDGLEHLSGIVQATSEEARKLDLDNMNEYARYIAERKSYSLIDPAKAKELDKLLVSKNVALIPTGSGRWRMVSERREDYAREDAEYARNPALAYVPDDVRKFWETSAVYKLDKPDDFAQVSEGYQKIRSLLIEHYRAGGKVLAGSDTFNSVPGLSLLRELIFLVDVGFTPLQAITMATRDNAQFLRQDKELGTIAAGKLADIIVVNANPLAEIRHIERIAVVIKNGQIVDTTYHADFSVPTRRPNLTRPLWIERQLQNEQKRPTAKGHE